ncbi:MAG: hypothetical protein JNJ91_04155, partial [Flavobacteriales bacterium]|nr:hypothetical protein [Flavobacteriales bacterium]
MHRSAFLLLTCIFSVHLGAQVQLDRPLVLNSATDTDRQVTGLEASGAPAAVLTTAVARSGSYRVGAPGSGEIWSITVEALTSAPVAGTHLVIITPAASTGAAQLSVNGHGPYPILSGPNTPIMGADIEPGTLL